MSITLVKKYSFTFYLINSIALFRSGEKEEHSLCWFCLLFSFLTFATSQIYPHNFKEKNLGWGRSEDIWNHNLIEISYLSRNIRYLLYTIWKIQKTRSQKKQFRKLKTIRKGISLYYQLFEEEQCFLLKFSKKRMVSSVSDNTFISSKKC